MTDRESRKAALADAKKRLAERRKERDDLKVLRDQRKKGVGGPQDDYGKKLVDETVGLIKQWKEPPPKPEVLSSSAGANIPGRRAQLVQVTPVNTIDIFKKPKECYDKIIETDPTEIAQGGELITEETSDTIIDQILATFISNEVKPWPPKSKLTPQQLQASQASAQTGAGNQGQVSSDAKKLENKDGYESEPEEKIEKEPESLIMPLEEANKLISNKDFIEAFKLKTIWMERVLAVNEEHQIFWEADAVTNNKKEEEQVDKVVFKKFFTDTSNVLNKRPVTSIDFSKLNPDWFLASFAEASQESYNDLSDGVVNIWSLLLPNHPEYSLECQSMITCALFHPTNPKLVLGSTVSGQVIVWDVRAKKTPISRTNFSSGHSSPVFTMKFLPGLQSKVQHIYTVSNDAKLCTWRDDLLVQPNHEIILKIKDDHNASTTELSTTCFSFPSRDINQVVLGSDEGCLYIAEIHGQNERDGTVIQNKIDAHFGPISNVDFHPSPSGRKLGQHIPNLYLTSSYDWTVKLWDHKSNKTIQAFEQMQDYVYDVQWSTGKPSVFACGDGLGRLMIFDLMKDFDSPVADIRVSETAAISKISWGRDGKYIIVGDSEGKLALYELHSSLYETTDDDFVKFDDTLKKRISKLA